MTYKREGDQITLGMHIEQFNWLLIYLGFAASASRQMGDLDLFYSLFAFLNEVNADNPEYRKYNIPETPQ